ncbi:MAG TPA: apolipoprotein N-acyltransferase [Gammaproteobacteria bacterium]|nr:apolipoprotein N-acyltransferase [Gammaproteobacteria bacterium]
MNRLFDSPLRYPFALVAGLAMPLAFAPFGMGWIVIVALALIFAIVAAPESGRGTLPAGYLFGLGYAGFGVYWIFVSVSRYGGGFLAASIATPILIALFSLYPMVALWIGRRLGRGRPGVTCLVTLPLTWIAVEWIRSWLFTGATWLDIGYTQIDLPPAALAPIVGTFGVGLLVALLAGALAWLVLRPSPLNAVPAVVLLAAFFASGLADRVQWTHPTGKAVTVSLVQGNIPQDEKWRENNRVQTLQYYVKAAQARFGRGLVIWPETAVPAFYHQVSKDWLQPLAKQAAAAGTSIVTGVPMVDVARKAAFNAVMVLGDDKDVYYKRHLVPFGEYVPFRDWLGGALDFVGVPLGDFSAGTQPTLLKADGITIGPSVCYEVTFGSEIAEELPGARLLVNVSNDGWFGDSSAPYQHLEMARMRALETGRYMLRSTNTGITAIVDEHGTVVSRAPMFQRTILDGEAQPRAGATPYVRWKDWPVVGVVFAGLAIVVLTVRRRQRLFG